MSHPPSTRRRGAQPGNVNRLKHGMYSRRFELRAGDPASLAGPPARGLQLALARKRLLRLLDLQASATRHDYLSYERGILHYLELILALTRPVAHRRSAAFIDSPASSDLLVRDGHPFIGIMESIRLFNAAASEELIPHSKPIGTSALDEENYP